MTSKSPMAAARIAPAIEALGLSPVRQEQALRLAGLVAERSRTGTKPLVADCFDQLDLLVETQTDRGNANRRLRNLVNAINEAAERTNTDIEAVLHGEDILGDQRELRFLALSNEDPGARLGDLDAVPQPPVDTTAQELGPGQLPLLRIALCFSEDLLEPVGAFEAEVVSSLKASRFEVEIQRTSTGDVSDTRIHNLKWANVILVVVSPKLIADPLLKQLEGIYEPDRLIVPIMGEPIPDSAQLGRLQGMQGYLFAEGEVPLARLNGHELVDLANLMADDFAKDGPLTEKTLSILTAPI